jgi:hypothetical protein
MPDARGVRPGVASAGVGVSGGRSIGRALGWAALMLPLVLAVLVPLGLLVVAPVTPIAAGLGARRHPTSWPGWGPGWLAFVAGAVPLLLNPWSLIPLCAPEDLGVLRMSMGVAALVLVAGSGIGGYRGSSRVWVISAVLYAVTFALVFTVGGGLDVEMVC